MVVGVDVSKAELVYWTGRSAKAVPNTPAGVSRLLAQVPSGTLIAMEATGLFHRLLADTAADRGFPVAVLNPRDVSRFRKSIASRAETDRIAARVITDFASIRPPHLYTPVEPLVERIKRVVRQRASLIAQRVALEHQGAQDKQLAVDLKPAVRTLQRTAGKLERELALLARSLPEYGRLVAIPGFGPITTPYLIAMLRSGEFPTADSFVAFLGLDLQFKDSGTHRGRRRLSKRGDPQARHLLFLAARAAVRADGPYRDVFLRSRAQGWSKTASSVIVARKLARTAWSLYHHGTQYRAERVLSQPSSAPAPVAGATTETVATSQLNSPAATTDTPARLPLADISGANQVLICA